MVGKLAGGKADHAVVGKLAGGTERVRESDTERVRESDTVRERERIVRARKERESERECIKKKKFFL